MARVITEKEVVANATTTIRIKRSTKERLTASGHKGQTYDDIIMQLFHERNILSIRVFYDDNSLPFDNETLAVECFRICNIPLPKLKLKTFQKYCETVDKNLCSNNADIVTKIYCLCWEIQNPFDED